MPREIVVSRNVVSAVVGNCNIKKLDASRLRFSLGEKLAEAKPVLIWPRKDKLYSDGILGERDRKVRCESKKT